MRRDVMIGTRSSMFIVEARARTQVGGYFAST
jgi:hypothetical protein